MDQNTQEQVLHGFTNRKSLFSPIIIGIFILIIIAGIGGGYLLVKKSPLSLMPGQSTSQSGKVSTGSVYGTNDTATFKDTTEGTMTQGGIDGEGQYHLVRPGGDSQNVYLTSSLVDLSQFLGKKVKVWGQTQKAQRAGWLMDVGRVEVL